MTLQLDDIDHQILRILQQDALASMDDIAEKITLSRNACWRRIKNLETSGVIKSRVALLDADLLGLGLTVFVMIKTDSHEGTWIRRFQKAVANMPQIMGAHRLSGDLDYMLKVHVADMPSYDAFFQNLIAQVPIASISASFVLEDLKSTTELPI